MELSRVAPASVLLQGQAARANSKGNAASPSDSLELSAEALAEVARLRRTDQKVHAHEAAHMAAGGGLVRGGASYGYRRGPDGRMYAVSGEVTLDASPGRDAAATLAKAQRVQAAALAPADPSPQDRAVAAQAAAMAAQARAELARQGSGKRLDLLA